MSDVLKHFDQIDQTDLHDLAARLHGRPVPDLSMSESEFIAWSQGNPRAEWVDGRVVLMSPTNVDHDDLNTWLTAILRTFVEDRADGRIFHDLLIRLSAQRRVRVPDLMWVSESRLRLLRPTFLAGAPDLLIEIVSPDIQSRDRREKYEEYEKAGVREYWIVDPITHDVEASRLVGRKFQPLLEENGTLSSTVLRGFSLKTSYLWQKPLPKVSSVLRAMRRT